MINLNDARSPAPGLSGRRAVVTGGSSGIGRAIAVMLAREGARVFIGGRDQHLLDEALAAIRAVGDGDGAVMDLSHSDAPKRFSDLAAERLGGGYDICVLNASVAAGGLTQIDEAELHRVIAVNFSAYLLGAHAAVAAMGGTGDLILIGSMAAHVRGPSSTVYAGIKSGIAGFAEALRRELGPKGIRVSLIEPGKTASHMQLPDVPPEKQQAMIAADQMLAAEDIALGVRYLLSQPRRTVVQQLVIVPRGLDE